MAEGGEVPGREARVVVGGPHEPVEVDLARPSAHGAPPGAGRSPGRGAAPGRGHFDPGRRGA